MIDIYKEHIIKFIGATEEDPAFINTMIDSTFAIMQRILRRKIEYAEYNENHKVTRYGEVFINEIPIDIAKAPKIWLLDALEMPTREITAYKISLYRDYIMVPISESKAVSFAEIDNDFYGTSNENYVQVTYTGGFKELPDDLLLLLENITKFFYVNRDPGISSTRSENLVKTIGDYNPEIREIIGYWKCRNL